MSYARTSKAYLRASYRLFGVHEKLFVGQCHEPSGKQCVALVNLSFLSEEQRKRVCESIWKATDTVKELMKKGPPPTTEAVS